MRIGIRCMKKIFMFLIVILLVSCHGNSDHFKMIPITGETGVYDEIYEDMRKELYDLPDTFDINGDYEETLIIFPLNADQSVKVKLDYLYDEILKGNEIDRIIVDYTDEGDAILVYVKYDGHTVFIVSDTTRDGFGSPQYYQKSYKTIQYEANGNEHLYIAVHDTKYTYNQLRKSWEDNDYKSGIDYYVIAYYVDRNNNE